MFGIHCVTSVMQYEGCFMVCKLSFHSVSAEFQSLANMAAALAYFIQLQPVLMCNFLGGFV